MYNNIDTDHTIKVITWWLNDLDANNKLGLYFPLEAILETMTIIMEQTCSSLGIATFCKLWVLQQWLCGLLFILHPRGTHTHSKSRAAPFLFQMIHR
jgi:hypothetical protein